MKFMRKGEFKWMEVSQQSFQRLKKKVTESSILSLPYFDKVFQVECDASELAIGFVMSQEIPPTTFFSENMDNSS